MILKSYLFEADLCMIISRINLVITNYFFGSSLHMLINRNFNLLQIYQALN